MAKDWITLVLSLPWAKPILALIAWVKKLRAKPDPLAGLSRKHRRAILFASTDEKRMRSQRTADRWRKRHKDKRPSDNGAKYKRAYAAGYMQGGRAALEGLRARIEGSKTEADRVRALGRKAA